MRVTSVELHPSGSSSVIDLSFRDPRRNNPYNVRAIVGLDADDIVARYYGGSGAQKFYNLSLEKRDLVFRIELNPNMSSQTVSSLRDNLYRVIASSRTGLVDVHFKDGATGVAKVSGFVSKFEAAHFSKTPEVQMTIDCPHPILKAPTPVAVDISGLDPAGTTITDALSTSPHGFKFEMEFLNALPSLTISDPNNAGWSFSVNPLDGFAAGDILHFSSEYDEKYLYIVRVTETIHLASAISPGSIWPVIFPGDNDLEFEDAADLTWNAISYYPTYWGV